jgi:polyhydroxyalkanoate synthase
MRLRAYGEPVPGPVLLLVPAPIKRHYVWDLAPGRSVVRRALAAGFNIGLLEWTGPEGEAAGHGLDDHADRLLGVAVDALSARHGSGGALLAGHSLGGTLAAVFAALHPDRVPGLMLIEAPLRFGPDAGALGTLAAAAPSAPEAVREAFGVVPGSAISAFGVAADPVEFLPSRWLDALASAFGPESAATHLRVVRWTLDELAMPGRLFQEVAGRLCRDDAFARGVLEFAGRPALPQRLRMPVLAVLDPLSRLVPPAAVLPVLGLAGRTPTVLHHHEDEAGVALRHVGALVGRAAHERLWPAILGWAGAVWAGGSGPRR